MPSLEAIQQVASRLDEFAQFLLGPGGSTRGRPLEKYYAPALAGGAEALSLKGEPSLIFPVWVAVLPEAEQGQIASTKKPADGVLSFWREPATALLAFEAGRSTETVVLNRGGFDARPVEFHKKKTVVPGMVASNRSWHVAIGLRNAISVGASLTDRSKPYFSEIAEAIGASG